MTTETKAQEAQILEHLEEGHELTPLDALKKFRSMRLGARIHSLRRKGHRITTTLVARNGKRVASYRLG